MVNKIMEKQNIIQVLKNEGPMQYGALKTKCGYSLEDCREFVNLLKLGIRLDIIHLHRESRTYCTSDCFISSKNF